MEGKSIKSNELENKLYNDRNKKYIKNLFSFAEIALGVAK